MDWNASDSSKKLQDVLVLFLKLKNQKEEERNRTLLRNTLPGPRLIKNIFGNFNRRRAKICAKMKRYRQNTWDDEAKDTPEHLLDRSDQLDRYTLRMSRERFQSKYRHLGIADTFWIRYFFIVLVLK